MKYFQDGQISNIGTVPTEIVHTLITKEEKQFIGKPEVTLKLLRILLPNHVINPQASVLGEYGMYV